MADGALGQQGRKVRCAGCAHSWLAGPDGKPAEDAIILETAPPKPQGPTRADVERARRAEIKPHDQMRARIQARNRQAQTANAVKSWVVSGLAFAILLSLAISNRQLIVEAWPKAASAYAMVGLKVNAYGLDYFNVKASRGYQGSTPVLKVRGEVRNVSKRARAAPDVRIALRNKKGAEIFHWKTPVDALIIGPNEAAPFASYIANPPAEAYDVAISFERAPSPGEASAKPHAGSVTAPAPSDHPVAPEAAPDAHPAAPDAPHGSDSEAHPAPHG